MLLGALLTLPAHASWMVPPAPDRPKDFTILKRDGLYHLFYIRNNPNLAPESTQVDFGHATSADLYFWDTHPPVVPVRPGLFDRSHVWAPSIVQRDGVYWMFYTGVSDSAGVENAAQRIGVATSVDLETWNALEEPILTANAVTWAWWDSTRATPFRDPFVMVDPTTPGRWLLYYSTAPAADPSGMVAGVAASDGDFTQWHDLQPMWITNQQWSFNSVVESPHLFEHDGLWFFFFTTNSGQPISYATSPNPLAPPEQWIYRGRLANMLGLNTGGWFASEYLRDGLVEYLCYVNGDRVEISRMLWQAGQPRFSLQQPELFHVRTLDWQTPSVHEDSTTTIRITSKWWAGHTLDLEAFWIDSTGAWHAVPNSEIDLPAHIPLNGDVTDYTWLAQAPVDTSSAPAESVQIVVRTLDQTAVSNPIWVVRGAPGRPRISPDLDPPPEIEPVVTLPGAEETPSEPLPILKPLVRETLGAPAALLVTLPEERAGRLDVFDLQGRRVRRLADRRLPAGATVIGWDGRDEGGRRVRGGLYFVRLVTPQETRTARVVIR